MYPQPCKGTRSCVVKGLKNGNLFYSFWNAEIINKPTKIQTFQKLVMAKLCFVILALLVVFCPPVMVARKLRNAGLDGKCPASEYLVEGKGCLSKCRINNGDNKKNEPIKNRQFSQHVTTCQDCLNLCAEHPGVDCGPGTTCGCNYFTWEGVVTTNCDSFPWQWEKDKTELQLQYWHQNRDV